MFKPLLVLLALVCVACATPATPTPNAPTKFRFWYALTGAPSEATIELARRFNDTRTRCIVELMPHDLADEVFVKLKTGARTKELPALAHVSHVATQALLDLQIVEPIQKFVDRDRFDIRDLDARALAVYTDAGIVYGMPYNITTAVLYYNHDAFRAAGLDPQQPPRTFAQVTAAARQLTQRNAEGRLTRYGFAMAIFGWFFEQLLANSGGLLLDNGNGRDARATRALFNSPEGIAILTWWKDGFDARAFGNLGRPTSETQKAFDAQQIAMMIDSTAGLPARIDAARGKFTVGIAPLPRPDDAPPSAGALIGGGALYILKDRPAAEKECAWEFVRFIITPETQADWHGATGFFPLTPTAYAHAPSQAWRARYPQFDRALEQWRATPTNRITQGALSGALPATRQRVELAIEQVLQGKATPQHALDRAASDVTQLIREYARTIPTQ